MLNEVAPPGWGHTKAEKEKTKPWKPKSKIGGTAAAFKRALDDGRFKGLPGSKTKKEKTADMFKLMWSMKKKGDKPHYKPGTDKKYKKYQDESFGFEIDSEKHKTAQKKSKMRNLARGNENPNEKAAAEKKAGGPKLAGEDWKPEIEHIKGSDLRKKTAEKKRKAAADSLPPHLRLDVMKKAFKHTNEETSMPNVEKKDRGAIKKRFKGLFKKDIKGTVPGVNEGNLHNKMDTFKSKAVKRRDEKSFGTIASATKRYELLKKIIGSKKKHDKPAIKK